jgi:hypothetical protein
MDDNPIEEKVYVDPIDNRLYIFSTKYTRSQPIIGNFPIWDGKRKIISQFSNKKYLSDVNAIDIGVLVSKIDNRIANKVISARRRSEQNDVLKPQLVDEDNMFTQCIKGVINNKNYTIVDLMEMSNGLSENQIINYYNALNKITFMRMDKWIIWLNNILHMNYTITVYDGNKELITYDDKENKFYTGITNYDAITSTPDDPFKKLIKILIVMLNIDKSKLRSKEVDDYTINNMMSIVNSDKNISSQLFSRFIRLTNLSYIVRIYEQSELVFEYREV